MEFEDDFEEAPEVENEEILSVDDNDGVEDPDAAAGGASQGEEEEQPQVVQQPQPENDPKYNSLAAAHRILNRNNEALSRRYRELERQHAELIGMVRAKFPVGGQQEEQLPDPEEDLGGHLVGRLDRFEKQQELERKQRAEKEAQEAAVEEFFDARTAAIEFRSSLEDPAEYDVALQFLGQLAWEEALEEDVTSTEEEIRDRLASGLVDQMKKWHRSGANPGEKLLAMARRRGLRYERQQPQQQQPAPRTTPRTQIREEKQRQQKGRTITNLSGAPPSAKVGAPAKHLQSDEADWVKDHKDVPLRDLLKGKGRRDVGSQRM